MNRYAAAERSLLEHISTHWAMIEDPAKFVLRYAPAIREYINNLLKGQQDSDDVTQDFLTAVMTRGFSEKQVTRGRFRDFLRVAVRNAVIDHLRVRRPTATDHQIFEETLASTDEVDWINYWRGCLLEKAWRKLRQYQRAHDGNMYHSVLKLATDFPQEDSQRLAQRASKTVGRPIRADAYRQQLHRARTKFAQIIVDEVRETLRHQEPSEVEDELRVLGLDRYVNDFRES
jgi:RNA polymerase sigma-70 factor (ECF subfamily)